MEAISNLFWIVIFAFVQLFGLAFVGLFGFWRIWLMWVAVAVVIALAAIRSRSLAVLVIAVLVAGVTVAWVKRRNAYAAGERVIADRIAAMPRLRFVRDAPDTLVIRGLYVDRQLLGPNCMARVFYQSGHARPVVAVQGSAPPLDAPPRHHLLLEPADDVGRLGDLGDTGLRGPFALWLIDGDRRTLIDVSYRRSAPRLLPNPIFPYGDAAPPSQTYDQRSQQLMALVVGATGRCA